jgi:UrcA family protein
MIGACVAVFTLPALAGSPVLAEPKAPTRVVSYSDLNLSTEPGARELLNRLQAAAWQVCDDVRAGQLDLQATLRFAACRDAAVEAAVRTVGSERLAEVFQVTVRRPDRKARVAKAN